MSEDYQENYEDNNYQAPPKNNDKAVITALMVFLLIAFIFGSLIVGGGYFLIKYVDNQEKLTETKKIYKKIKLLSTSNVSEYTGSVEFNTNGNWSQLKEKIKFEDATGFKTSEDSSVSIHMYSDNQVKLYSSSEFWVSPPEIDDSNEKLKRQFVKLTNGEITAAVSITARGILHVKVSDITIVAQSGLFKVIYDEKEDKGEVVVKNGLIEVKENGSEFSPTKLTGFYKVKFEKGKLNSPEQASVIQYEWR